MTENGPARLIEMLTDTLKTNLKRVLSLEDIARDALDKAGRAAEEASTAMDDIENLIELRPDLVGPTYLEIYGCRDDSAAKDVLERVTKNRNRVERMRALKVLEQEVAS